MSKKKAKKRTKKRTVPSYGNKREHSFISVVDKRVDKTLESTRWTQIQMCIDAAMIAANEIFNMGPTRAPKFEQSFLETYIDIIDTITEDTKDLEYTKEVLDRKLKPIWGEENFKPYDVRYNRM